MGNRIFIVSKYHSTEYFLITKGKEEVKMIQDLRKRMEAQTKKIQEMFNKELENVKNKQSRTIQ